MRKICLTLLLAAIPALGQLENNTITITASRQVTLQPDQIAFTVQVLAPVTVGLDDVLAKVAGSGITATNLNSVYTSFNDMVEWYFTLAVPLSQTSATTKLLSQLAQNDQNVLFNVQGTQVSQALQQSQPCSQASLISDAQAQAQTLAAAAGFSVGPVLAVSDGSGTPTVARLVAGVLGATLIAGPYVAALPVVPQLPTTCTAVVKFRLYQYH